MKYEIDDSVPASPQVYNPGRGGKQAEWIVVHYTAHIAPARNFAQASHTPTVTSGSWHWCIDDTSIFQSVHPANTAWHAGNSDFNQRSLGIEVVSDGDDFTPGEIERLAWLVKKLMVDYNVDPSHVIRHYDVIDHVRTGSTVNPHKCCPAPYAPNGYDPCETKWKQLHAIITGGGEEEDMDMTFIGRSNTKEPLKFFCGIDYMPIRTQAQSDAIQQLYKKIHGRDIPMIESPYVSAYTAVLDGSY